MRQVLSRGYPIAYDVAGSGPTVLLVAGLSMWRGQWSDLGYVAALSDEFRVVSVDPLGHGDSAKPHDSGAYYSAEVAADVVAVLDAEEVSMAVLWGFSAGAQIALGVASIAPERVRGVVCGSGGWRNEPVAELSWCQPIVEVLRSPGGLEQFWAHVGFDDPEQVRYALGRNDADAIASAIEGSTTWRPDYDRLQVPILSYRGDQEQLDHNDALMRQLGAECHIIPNADHMDCFNRQATVVELVRPFLRRIGTPPADR